MATFAGTAGVRIIDEIHDAQAEGLGNPGFRILAGLAIPASILMPVSRAIACNL